MSYTPGMRAIDIPNFEKLTDLERIALAEDLMASVRQPDELPVPIAHQLELDRRWRAYEQNPETGLSEDQFWARVRSLQK